MAVEAPLAKPRGGLAWKITAGIVTALSLLWVAALLARAWPMLAARADEIQIPLLALGFVFSLVSAILTFEAFAIFVRRFQGRRLPIRQLAHLYFTAQLLKHLPGRIWGVGYQWMSGRSAGSLGDWLSANVSHMVVATFFALWSAWLVLGFASGLEWGLVALVGGLLAYAGGWALLAHPTLQRWMALPLRRLGGNGPRVLEDAVRLPVGLRVSIFLVFCTGWLFLYLAWFAYGAAYPALGGMGGVELCAIYMLAWFVGYVSLVTPSGLGVRELVFAWLAREYAGDAVALMAIVGRVSLLGVDVVLGLMFAPFAPRNDAAVNS